MFNFGDDVLVEKVLFKVIKMKLCKEDLLLLFVISECKYDIVIVF